MTPSYVAVHPFVWPPYADAMRATCKLDLFDIDNTVNNRGHSASVNMGIDRMKRDDADWLIVVGSSVRFGAPGGLDLVDVLSATTEPVIEAAPVFGWHLMAFHRRVIEDLGYWDTNLDPYGSNDQDYSLRFQRFYGVDGTQTRLWPLVAVDGTDTTMAHGVTLAGLESPAAPRSDYFKRKWGVRPGDRTGGAFGHPFNDPANPVSYFPGVPT